MPPHRLAALAGFSGATLFAGATIGLSIAQYEFMRSLGWRPLADPTFDWPSGLALGPYGGLMTAAFLGGGALLALFAGGIRRALDPVPGAGPRFLFAAGVALMLLASPTDPTLRTTPATLTGRLHDAAFVLLGVSFLPALLLLAARFRTHPVWRNLALPTLLVALTAAPAFILKGAAFYAFLIAAHLWIIGVAARLWHIAPDSPQ
jgi:hypothetical protein